MLSFLPGVIRGVLSFLTISINTVLMSTVIFIMACLKLAIPAKSWRVICDRILIFMATTWIRNNVLVSQLMHQIHWDVRGVEKLSRKDWCLVVSNHQSWVDIFVLQTVFLGRIPFLKFFLKKELIWVPFLGIVWWALDFPFMRRHSHTYLRKYPNLKGADMENTKKACQKFKTTPVSVMNFMEGTRFTNAKHALQKSPHRHLLRPKAGGVAFVLGAMGDSLTSLVDVTIVYPDGVKNIWEFLCGKVPRIKVRVETTPITQELQGDYFGDKQYRVSIQRWVNALWCKKDLTIKGLLLPP